MKVMPLRKILVVDDSITAREIFADEVRDLGYAPSRADSAEAAMKMANWERFDGYILDIRLPGISGFELLHEIKKVNPEAVVVLVSQFDVARPERAIQSYENVWFFRKPTDMLVLAATLKNAFESQELRRDVERMRALTVGLKSVGQVKDLAQEFRVLLHLAVDSLSADAGAIFLRSDRSGLEDHLKLEVSVGLPQETVQAEIPLQGALLRCMDRQEDLRVSTARVAKVPELRQLFPGVGRVHLLAVPLTAGHKLIGVLELFRDVERPSFSEKDSAMARLYAATAAVALENLKLSESAEISYREQLKAQRELVQARKLSSLGQVTAGLSHEIRNPLTVILGNVDLMRVKLKAPEFDPYLERISDQCDRVLRLVEDLKAVYHPGNATRGYFRLRDLVAEALAVAPPPVRDAHAEIVVSTQCDLEEDTIEGDFPQLLQVMVNLLTNAYFVLDQGGLVEVRVQGSLAEKTIVVHDSGPGISAEHGAHIFTPFYTTKGSEGTGLGLWISDTILRNHGGLLDLVDSEKGGACFHLRFPCGGEEGTASAPPLKRESESNAESLAHILVVDDDEEVRWYLGELLESEGYQVTLCDGVVSAKEALEAESFDLTVLDGDLRGAMGTDFYRRTIKPKYGLPAIYFTGSDETQSPELLAMGFRAVVRKPARGHRILEAVRRSLLSHVVRPGQVSG